MALLAIAAVLVVGCGGDDGTTVMTIKMADYFYEPSDATTKAGPTLLRAPNHGAAEHELVLLKTSIDPANLPTEPSGDVDEGLLKELAKEIGRIDVEVGETKSGRFDLAPGKYVMFCNVPGHYAQGMYGTLTVTR